MNSEKSRTIYHEPNWVRDLSKYLRCIRGHGGNPTAPHDRVEPSLVHWVHCHTDVVGKIFPGGEATHADISIACGF